MNEKLSNFCIVTLVDTISEKPKRCKITKLELVIHKRVDR